MLTTEAEARQKWCPLARVGNAAGCNRFPLGNDDPFAKCIASDCMAWRWGPVMSKKDGVVHAGDIVGGQPLEMGFCGQFGSLYAAVRE